MLREIQTNLAKIKAVITTLTFVAKSSNPKSSLLPGVQKTALPTILNLKIL